MMGFRLNPVRITELTSISIDPEYAVDLVYWRFRGFVADRFEAETLAGELYSGLHPIVPLGEHFIRLESILNRMVKLSNENDFASNANQIQGLWFHVAEVIGNESEYLSHNPFEEFFKPAESHELDRLRPEVLRVAELLEQCPERNWTLQQLAQIVHLSPNYLAELCSRAWGHSPRTRLRLLRTHRLARYLRETNIPVKQCVRLVGWRNHTHAVRIFRSSMGLTPSEYRLAHYRDAFETFGHPSHDAGHDSPGDTRQKLRSG